MNAIPQKVAIVTGASGGIGRAIALRLAHDGFAIAVHYAGNRAKAHAAVQAVEEQGGKAIAVAGDIGHEPDVQALFEATQKAFGRLDVVVNSAGTMPLGAVADCDPVIFDRVIATNLRGTFLVMQQAARRLNKGGRIVAISSSVVAKAFPTYGAYIASKAGVEGLVHVLANELRGRDITVNAIAPGPVGTELFLKGKSDELIAKIAQQSPMERIGKPEEIAASVAFVVGSDGTWVNSQVLRVNGGFA